MQSCITIVKYTEANRVTCKMARLIGFEPMPDGCFERLSETAIRCIHRPLQKVNGYSGICPETFDPYKDGNDCLMVAGYLNITLENIVVAGGTQAVRAYNHEFETEVQTVNDSPFMFQHAKMARRAIMQIAEMFVKKHFDIDPSGTTTITREFQQAGA